ncbi:hypothetical protein [Photobacterium sp. DNB22_13_2]
MANLYTLRQQPLACIPVLSFFFQVLKMAYKILMVTVDSTQVEQSKQYRVTRTDRYGSKNTTIENGDGTVIFILGIVAIGYLLYYANTIASFALEVLLNSWGILMIPLFVAGFFAQFGRSRLDRAMAAWDINSTSKPAWLILAVRGCALLLPVFILINNESLLARQWYELLIAAIVIPFCSYYLLFRPLASSLIMTSAYYVYAPRNWRAILDPMHIAIALVFFCCYLTYTGQTDNLVMVQSGDKEVGFDLYRLMGISIFWSIIVATQTGVCYGLGKALGSNEYSIVRRFIILALTIGSCWLSVTVLNDVLNAHRMARFTDMLISIDALAWLKSVMFWSYVFFSIVFIPFVMRFNWKNILWGLVAHVFLMMWILVIFDIPEYSTWLHDYSQGILSVFMIISSIIAGTFNSII